MRFQRYKFAIRTLINSTLLKDIKEISIKAMARVIDQYNQQLIQK